MFPEHLSRRSFLQSSGGALIGLSALGCAGSSSLLAGRAVFGAEEEIRLAVVGLHGRGRNHVDGFRRLENVRVVALCDVDLQVLEHEGAKFAERGETVDLVQDFRDLLKRRDIHGVSLATPNHWHALQTVWACEAGKDVYVEKPVCHNYVEGQRMVAAARRNHRVVQVGTQSRSSNAIRDAIAWMHAGNLGKIQIARGFCYKPRKSIGKVAGPQSVPAHIDYNMWTGPAPLVPLERARLHYDWHWDSATGNGDLGNQGVHQVDLCRWALGEQSFPTEVLSIGGRLGYDDDANTPNTQILWANYPTAPMLFEVRGLPSNLQAQKKDWGGSMDNYRGVRIGVVVDCEQGSLRIPNYSSAEALDDKGNSIHKWNGANNHFADFVDAVRSGRAQDLSADIQEGHLSAAPCHFASLSHHLGSSQSLAKIQAVVAGNPYMKDALERMAQHLLANQVDLAKTPLTMGRSLVAKDGNLPATLAADPGTAPWLFREGRDEFEFPA